MNKDEYLFISKNKSSMQTLGKMDKTDFDQDYQQDNPYVHKSVTKINLGKTMSLFKKFQENFENNNPTTTFQLAYDEDDLKMPKKNLSSSFNHDTIIKKSNSIKEIQPFMQVSKSKTVSLRKSMKSKVIETNDLNLTTKKVLETGVFFELEPNSKTRDYMEDYINIQNKKTDEHFYVLCDGHTGSKAAEIVVKDLPDILIKHLMLIKESELTEGLCEQAFKEAFIEMDDSLQGDIGADESEGKPCDPSGCCTNIVYLCWENDKRIIYSGNVGDSRTILIRDNSVLRLSYDHKASDKQEFKRVKQEGGVIIRKRLYGTLAVTRTHGDFEMKENAKCLNCNPHITRTEIDDTDKYIVIASDGVWDVIKDEEVLKIVNATDFTTLDNITNKPKDLAKMLVKLSVDLGSQDNISCIVIKLN